MSKGGSTNGILEAKRAKRERRKGKESKKKPPGPSPLTYPFLLLKQTFSARKKGTALTRVTQTSEEITLIQTQNV